MTNPNHDHDQNQNDDQYARDLTALTAGGYTGWWDETGQPAPFPNDFFDPDSDWRPATDPSPGLAHGEPAF